MTKLLKLNGGSCEQESQCRTGTPFQKQARIGDDQSENVMTSSQIAQVDSTVLIENELQYSDGIGTKSMVLESSQVNMSEVISESYQDAI